MKGLFKYEYKENDKNIPEDQFGLVYKLNYDYRFNNGLYCQIS